MNINWKVRLKNKAFWLTFIPAALMLIQTVLSFMGITVDVGELGNKLIVVVDAVFVLLCMLGIVNDPTVATFSDSTQALTYEEPKSGEKNE